jgi:succinate dehydrogenase / fumarate reductase membrane anchor subunit
MTQNTQTQSVKTPRTYESVAWKWMRYSGILLIPLVWVHLVLQDVIVGVHQIDSSYVAARWGMVFWQVYDMALLGFALAHGVNGFRQVIQDNVHHERAMKYISVLLLVFWGVLTFIGAGGILLATRSVVMP